MLTYALCYIEMNMFSQNWICLQISSVMTLSYHLVNKLLWSVKDWTPARRDYIYISVFSGRYNILRSAEMQLPKQRLSLLSAGYIRLVWLKTERLCLFGSVSDTTAQPKCWWCSVFSLSIYSTYRVYLFKGFDVFVLYFFGGGGGGRIRNPGSIHWHVDLLL